MISVLVLLWCSFKYYSIILNLLILLEDFVENSGSKCPLATKEVLEDDTEDETDINEDENDHNATDPAKDEFNETKVFDKSTMPFLDWEPMEVICTYFHLIFYYSD